MLWGVITAKRSKIEPGQNLLEAVKVRSQIASFFVKNPNFKISQKKFSVDIQQVSKTNKCYFNEFFVGRTIWSAELKINFGLYGGSENFKNSFLPPGGSEVNQTGIMNDGSMDLQNEPLAVRICRNPCANIHPLRRASSVKALRIISNLMYRDG